MMELIIAMLEEMKDCVRYKIYSCNNELPELIITVDDFEGFDDEWSETMCDYNEDAIDNLKKYLEKNCVSCRKNLYSYYYFKDFNVELGYSSYDI